MKKLLCMVSASLIFASCIASADVVDLEKNKEVVKIFYQKALNEKDFSAAQPYLGDWYIQHNPLAKDGAEGFRDFLEYLKTTYPQSHSEIKQVFAEGDYVILHVHSVKEPGTRGAAIIDIFRLENSRIVEHWDVIQPIPEQSANGNGMF